MNVGAVYNVIRAQVLRDIDLLEKKPALTRAILGSPANPDEVLDNHETYFAKNHGSSDKTKIDRTKLKLVK